MNNELFDTEYYRKLSYKGPPYIKRPEPNKRPNIKNRYFLINEPYLIHTPYENGAKDPNLAIYGERALG